MKTFDLTKLGVQEMNSHELKTKEGGNPIAFFLGAMIGGALYDAGKFLVQKECERLGEPGAQSFYAWR